MYLIITIDAEEDNWGSFSPTSYTLENIYKIPELQALFDKFNVKPAYLLTYPVATDKKAISIFKKILEQDKNHAGSIYNLAIIYKDLGLINDAKREALRFNQITFSEWKP